MSDRQPANTIVLPIDLYGVRRPVLEALVRIAGQLDCRLLGLIVDDPRLQRVADLPFTTEIVLAGGTEREFLPQQVRARFARISRQTQRLLDELATHNRVGLSYEAVSGAGLQAVLQRGERLNLFLPGRVGGPARPAGAARVAIPRLGLLLGVAGYDAAIVAMARALVGAAMVGAVYVLSPRAPEPSRLQGLGQRGIRPHLLHQDDLSPAGVLALIRRSGYDLLILPRAALEGISPDAFEHALASARGQLLVVS
ncbi:hypothetical protein [Parahaliea mediterranea]|uniref:Universal stress protein n=1 Tax=Parahaliea mediterranea TaxID=651086 RepID=A0A939IIN9_9GAMM|nr:hypothetical protein [Parahaliea mediterranea]MBN7795451.1 hypothetical protein [Parahaliea mediterranea]